MGAGRCPADGRVEDGRISRMGRVSDVPTAGSDVVDGTRPVPDARPHRHVRPPLCATDLGLCLANGVVLVRDLWGAPLRLAMGALVARGKVAGLLRSVRYPHRQAGRGYSVTDNPISSGNRERAMRCIPFTVVALLGLLVSACAATGPVPTTPLSSQGREPSAPADGGSACDEAFAAAAAVGVTQDTVEHLYPTVRACESVGEWVAGVAANPGAIETSRGDVRVFLGDVCGSRTAGLDGTELCQQVLASCSEEPVWEMTLACASPSSGRDLGDGEAWG